MVKILQAYNFARQQTFALNGDILAATLIGNNRIAISSAEQFIEIYDIAGKQQQQQQPQLEPQENATQEDQTAAGGMGDAASPTPTPTPAIDERMPVRYTLATVGEVVQLIYCEAGKYLLTLEKEQAGSPVHSNSTSISCTSSSNSNTVCSEDDTKMFVRIYANFWKFPDAKLNELPITIRIASMTTPKTPLVESIDVIELPLRSPPDLVQSCQTSGNIIVSSRDRIYLYEYTQCVHENTQPRFSFIDFLPFKFFVQLNFVPLRLCLAENVIACLSHRYCVAFKVVDALANKTTTASAPAHEHSCLDNDYAGDEPLSESLSLGSKASAAAASSTHSQQSCESDSLQSSSSAKPALVSGPGLAGRTPLDFNVARLVNTAYGREFEPELRSQWDQCENGSNRSGGLEDGTQEITITPQRAADIKIKLINEAKAMNVRGIGAGGNSATEDVSVQYDIRKLLQICMRTSEPQSRVLDILRCMDLKAIYQRSSEQQLEEDDEYDMGNQQVPSAVTTFKHANRRTLKSSQHQRCVGHALLVASSVDGYLFQFCGQGKWYSENEKPVASYSFTAPVLQVHLNDYVVYAVTSESVETHTSRIGHKLFHNRFEYPSIGGLFPEESSPDVSSAIAVIGLAAFMHVQFVCVNRDQLVLITNTALEQHKRRSTGEVAVVAVKRNIAARFLAEAKAKHNSLLRSSSAVHSSVVNEWTLYNLEVPKVEHIVEDLEGIAESYRSASSSNFYDLMEEAHVMLRLSLTLQGERLGVDREQELRKMFMANCRKLADFSIRSNKQEVYLQATGFYKMCQLQLVDIYNNYIQEFMDSEQVVETAQLAGLIYTVKLFLLGLGTDRLRSSFLHQTVSPYFTPARVLQQGYKQVPLSLEFLNMFIKHAPADIPQIMLSSPVVADAMSGELINYLKYLTTLTPDETLLLAVTACRMSNYLLAQEIISKCTRRTLAVALIKHKNVLFDDSTVLYQRRQQPEQQQSQLTARKRSRRSATQAKGKSSGGCAATPTPSAIISFSDFCETILLANEQPALIEAISDAFIHALCIEHSITLDVVLQLFLNYIASHIGQKGYQTSQKVFVNILQVYYYDLYDVSSSLQPHEVRSQTPPQLDDDYDDECSSSRAPSLHSEADVQSLSSSCASSAPDERSLSGRQQRIVYDQLQDQQGGSPFQKRSSNASLSQPQPDDDVAATNLKGLKILFRMYMGRLKALSDLITDLQSADVEQQSGREDFLNLRMECIAYMVGMAPNYCSKPSVRQASESNQSNKLIFVPYIPDYKLAEGEEYEQHIKAYIRPIPCLLERPQYLNRLPPFERSDFSYPKKDEGEFEVRFTGWHNELLTLTLKIQSLLASSKVDREIISEFLAFIQKSPHLMGIDSFLVIILPKNLAINYMLSFCPAFLWQYGKSCGFTPKHWESLLRKILSKQEALPNWKAHIAEILNNLVAELSFEELLQCFPSEVIQNRNTAQYFAKEFAETCVLYEHEQLVFQTPEQPADSRQHMPMDNIDEDNVFELTLRKAVAKQRSIALRSMIESTGTQLFDATSNPMYNL
ncbi:uncharacterized protein LOC115770348 [Drosophila novamexicana]|uniref:uncharacterized protein LOC115770348 n=1 Tax=Drosophila novamexicana TaxID=47314 RepID=UPI0011E5CE22|nr:uncharacterized protein LOC115770348 [Drosophila novamexicana]XP_030571457.1 uncharacterized protein LOC115770348 [Drosophila novamexicana]